MSEKKSKYRWCPNGCGKTVVYGWGEVYLDIKPNQQGYYCEVCGKVFDKEDLK